jgi:hypothetical protein
LYNEELHSLYPSPNVIRKTKSRMMRWEGPAEPYNILVGKPEGKRPPGRHKHSWDDNFKVECREIGWGDVDWIHVDQGRDQCRALMNRVVNLQDPQNSGTYLSIWSNVDFSRRTQLHGVYRHK